MKTKWFGVSFLAFLCLSVAPALTSAQTVAATGALSSAAPLVSVQKLRGDIYEFNYLLTTGVGRYHQVGVHRVVRVENGKPIVSHNAILLAHGDAGTFNADFMAGTTSPQSLPVYLAKYGIDVWGIDYGWSLVPPSETDFTFMQTWNLQRDIDDLEKALAFTRLVRVIMGSDGGRLTLLGFSRSVDTGYALLNEETQKPRAQRMVKGFIPLDLAFTTNDPGAQSDACAAEAFFQSLLAQGIYDDNGGASDQVAGALALTDPNGISPFFPPDTNLQTILINGAATWEFGPGFPPYAHYIAGMFGPSGINGIPTGFHYATTLRYEEALISEASYEPAQLKAEAEAIRCGDGNAIFSSHLGQIRVPVFYVGAAGGVGKYGLYTLSKLGSDDIQHHIVRFYPADQYALDYGHFDPLIADNAQDVVWSRILAWLMNHEVDISGPGN
jgi:hypothetical protein